jgi:methyltransferase-like protein
MLMIDWIPERSGELLSSATDDGTVIVSPEDGRLNVVNEVGAFIWNLIDGQNSIEAIIQQVVDNFDVSASQAQADVHAFVQALSERRLVIRKGRS